MANDAEFCWRGKRLVGTGASEHVLAHLGEPAGGHGPTEAECRYGKRQDAAWATVGGEPGDGYVSLSTNRACVDGWYTANELRRIADAQERYAELVGGGLRRLRATMSACRHPSRRGIARLSSASLPAGSAGLGGVSCWCSPCQPRPFLSAF